jgi:hypothetical protein
LDHSLKIQHVKNGEITKNIQLDFADFDSIADYLHGHSKIPIEIVVSSKSISCKSISSKLSRVDLKNFALGNLKFDAVNTVFYENKSLGNGKSIAICYSLLSHHVVSIFQQLLNLGNNILGVTCWPIWLVSSYFDAFPKDRDKFCTAFFMIETDENWEIIVIHDSNFVCYRNVLSDNFDKNLETDNTIRYVTQVCKINPEDIAIYSINEETIANFTKKSAKYMNLVSSDIDYNCFKLSQYLCRVINTLCVIFLIVLPCKIISEFIDIFTIMNMANEAQTTMNTADRNVLSEANLWMIIDECAYKQQADFRSALENYVETTGSKLLQKAFLKLDDSSNEIVVNTTQMLDNSAINYSK